MKHKKVFVFPLLAVTLLALYAVLSVAQSVPPAYQLIATIPLPGGLTSFDISWIDAGSQRYYLADRTSTPGTGRIDVIDTQQNTYLYSIPTTKSEIGFVGTVPGGVHSGPNGVVAVPYLNQLYVGDGDSTVKVVDLAAKAIVAIISTGGTARADELAYDPLDHIIMITNPNDSPPYVSFISADTWSVLGRYTYPSTQVGLEQPVWNPKTKRFYMSVPATKTTVGGVDVFNPITMLLEKSFPTIGCSPAGLVLTPSQHLMTSCGVVLDAGTGNILATVAGVTGDEIWYNPGENLFYFGGTNTGVVDADTNKFVTYVSPSGRNLAVDPNNNRLFAPVGGVGIKVFVAQ
jgi:hypothetical protein